MYVDDLIILSKTEAEMQPLKDGLSKRFEMKDLGPAKYILGVRIEREADGSILLD